MAGVMVPGDSGRWEKVEIGWYVHDSGAVIQKWWKGYGSPGGRAGWYAWRAGRIGDDEWIGPFETAQKAALAALGGCDAQR